MIVVAVLRRKLPCQGVFSGSQCFDLADNFCQTLGAVSAENQFQLTHKIALGVLIAVHSHFDCRVSLGDAEGQCCFL